MKYIKWFIFAILDVLFNIVAYITNPIVCMFANEYGELPPIFLFWSNWDDGLDVDWMVYEHCVPKWAEYDFNRHYRYHDEWQAEKITGQHHGFVEILDPNFTCFERLQRYFCRLAWIYRNCAYGFSYYITGVRVNKSDIVKVRDEEDDIFYTTDNAWVLKYEKPSWGNHHWEIFLGWKMQNVTEDTERCMLAFRINPFQ